jgi:hypothetical protein
LVGDGVPLPEFAGRSGRVVLKLMLQELHSAFAFRQGLHGFGLLHYSDQ